MLIHLASDIVASWSVVAGVELHEPLALDVGSQATADPVGVGPNHGGVVTNGKTEPEIILNFLLGLFFLEAGVGYISYPTGAKKCAAQ